MRAVRILMMLVLGGAMVDAGDWSRFRGPNGSGVSTDDAPVPTEWSSSENLQWKTALPGPGASSPIVVGDRVFVTCYSGYGIERNSPGQIADLVRHLVCVDSKTGEMLWNKSVDAVQPEDPYSGIGVTAHGYASHTPVSDGQRVYVFFGKTGALAFDMDGNQLWQSSVGTESDPWAWGSASSPILYKNLLIVTASAESQALVALDAKTGEEVWRQEASSFDGLWGTPGLVHLDDGRLELVVSVPREVWAFNPDTGKARWYCEASQSQQAHTSAVVSDGVVYAITGRGGGSIAIRAGGKGDVTDSHVVWTGRDRARFGSPVVHEGVLYLVANGVLKCIDAETGDELGQTRLAGGSPPPQAAEQGRGRRGRGGGFGSLDYASPVIANGRLYYINGTGETFVVELGEEPKQIAVNRVTDENEFFGGSPAISDGRLYLRSNKHLYCVSEAR